MLTWSKELQHDLMRLYKCTDQLIAGGNDENWKELYRKWTLATQNICANWKPSLSKEETCRLIKNKHDLFMSEWLDTDKDGHKIQKMADHLFEIHNTPTATIIRFVKHQKIGIKI